MTPNAGLDYRKILIVNDSNNLEIPEYCKIPASQARIIDANYSAIKNGVIAYVKDYIKSAKKIVIYAIKNSYFQHYIIFMINLV